MRIGVVEGYPIVVIYTIRDRFIRIISQRPMRDNECNRIYEKKKGGDDK